MHLIFVKRAEPRCRRSVGWIRLLINNRNEKSGHFDEQKKGTNLALCFRPLPFFFETLPWTPGALAG
jgi:hypothetical protein